MHSSNTTNWFVAKKKQDLIQHFIQLFVPFIGMLLELGSAQIQGTCTVITFNMEVTKLGHGDGLTESGIDRESKHWKELAFFICRKQIQFKKYL